MGRPRELWPPDLVFTIHRVCGAVAAACRSQAVVIRVEFVEEQGSVSELAFREGIMDQIRLREQRFDERAYLFVLSALEHSQGKLTERRHITGPELAHACRDLALQRFGVMAKVVLDHWGMRSTMDIGDIVFTLVDLGLLISQPQDSRNDFLGVFDFADAFDREYPWSTTHV
jgi:uncharacterized repeat protein (TIGR04138 family)